MLYDISDVCRLFRLSPNSIRHYEKIGLIHPVRTSGGRRKYSIEEMRMLLHVKSLQSLGLDLQTIGEHFINTTSFPPEILSGVMKDKIAQIEQQITYLQSAVNMLRQYDQRLQSTHELCPQAISLPAVYFLPMEPLFGRTAAERDVLAKWFDTIPLVRKMDLYRVNGGQLLASHSGYCVFQDTALRLSLPLPEQTECLRFDNALKVQCNFPWRGQRGLDAEDLSMLISKVQAIRPWRQMRIMAAFLYGAHEGDLSQRYYELWIAEDAPS